MFEGDWSAYPSKSESDLALCSKIAFWWKVPATGDKSAVDRIYRLSELYQQGRSKWDRDDYRQRTIDKALEGAESRDSSYGSKRLVIGLGEKTDPDKPLELDSALTVAEDLQKTDEHFAEVFIHAMIHLLEVLQEILVVFIHCNSVLSREREGEERPRNSFDQQCLIKCLLRCRFRRIGAVLYS